MAPSPGGGRIVVAAPGSSSSMQLRPSASASSFFRSGLESSSSARADLTQRRASIRSAGSVGRGGREPTAAEAKKAEGVVARQRHIDALREEDQLRLRQRVDRGKQLREDRFQRMVNSLSGNHGVNAEVGVRLREEEAADQIKRQTMYGDWLATVREPIEAQAEHHFNGPTRAERQRAEGVRTVDFREPHQEEFRMFTAPMKDPLKKELVQRRWEEAFDREANQVIAGSRSTPDLARSTWSPIHGRSRPVLDPTEWGSVRLQAQPCGRWTQVVEGGPMARMGQTWASAPSEADGIPAAGKRTVRAGPRAVRHGDTGIYSRGQGTESWGEASRYKAWHGASSGAPIQDHFNYPVGGGAADAEFPLGKRLFPQWP